MDESIWETFGIYTLRKKVEVIIGFTIFVLLLVSAYYYYAMPKQAEAPKPVAAKVSHGPLADLLADYDISIFGEGNTTPVYLPSALDISNDLDWATLNTACGMTQFDLRRFESSWANWTVYRTGDRDIENGKPILLHVIMVNDSIACAYKASEGRPDDRYGLSQIIGAWVK